MQDAPTLETFAAAYAVGEQSGKFNHPRHLLSAWRKVWSACEEELPTTDPAFGQVFLTSWLDYVDRHAPAKVGWRP